MAQVPSNIKVLVDWDNDGDFDEAEEDITSFVHTLETRTGRDFPSLLSGRVAPGELRAVLRNDDDRFNFFNSVSPLNTAPFSLRTGRRVRVRTSSVSDPDAVLLARDRFGTAGALGVDEVGNTWAEPVGGGLQLTGSSGDYASAPDAAALRITGDIWLAVEASLDDWTTGTFRSFVGRFPGATNRSFVLQLRNDNSVGITWSEDGTSAMALSSSVAPAVADGGRLAFGVELDVDDGAGGHKATFYTAPTISGLWTQLGTVQTGVGTTSIFAGTADMEVGSNNGGTSGLVEGTIHAVEVRSGDQNGTLVADPNFAGQLRGDTSFTDDTGNTWTINGNATILGAYQVTTGGQAQATLEGGEHLAVVDVATADYYTQATLAEVGAETTGRTGSVVGLVYRYQDVDNHSLAVLDVDAAQLQLINVVAGTPTTLTTVTIEPRDHTTIGVLLSGSSVDLYLDGVQVATATAIQTDETHVGIYAAWGAGQPAPALDNFAAWDGLTAETTGVLWTGDTSQLISRVQAGPLKLASLTGRGWLSRTAGEKVSPPSSVTGRPTGQLVGNTLAMVGLLNPPGPLDDGDLTTGPVGIRDSDALIVLRRFEEAELGLLYETQEGPVGFASRTARAGETSAVTFSDNPGVGELPYEDLEPLDWRREVINRVLAGVAASAPSGFTATTPTTSTDMEVPMPATVNAGDLLLVFGTTFSGSVSDISAPAGWDTIYAQGDTDVGAMCFARVADGTEGGTSVVFADGSGAVTAAIVYRVTDWFGATEDGIATSRLSTTDEPLPVFPPWGPQPSLFIAGLHFISPLEQSYPIGYTVGTFTSVGAINVRSVQTATRLDVTTVERPVGFDSAATFQVSTVVAVRGFNGDPAVDRGVATVQVDDVDSQNDHNAILRHRNPSDLFADETDATAYANEVLSRHADDRPVVRLSFHATKSTAHRTQAVNRRVGDKITLVATGNAGMGINGDFFIENISHRWSQGNTLWEVTWELSPVP